MIDFDLVSPEKKLFSAKVAMVTLPGTEGYFGVLEGHAPFISTMKVGIIDVYENEMTTITRRILVAGGLVEVNPERCTVLAEEAAPLEDVTRDTLESELRKHTDSLQIAESDADREKLNARIVIVNAKLMLIGQTTAH